MSVSDPDTVHFGDVRIKILSNSKELTVSELYLPAGAVAGVHQHPHEEVNYVVSGTLDFMCNGKTTTLKAGDSIRIPPNKPHNITCLADSAATVLSVWTPSRQDLISKLYIN
ncbi:cupin domain-containing protein [Serratia proteamaculans]|uniref:cupin domain-containing protein n=1 Tax=Serratia proteamaculans TaxID=28151 RepID=UPI0015753D07|nr:cupin domain-containing protein [Serratia proteamaculans]NTX77439.1 cupin domain-containing protein [Serratia proteamaculans]NTZ28318.1 cupin domain-containing protein [Serratia proteamaculans]